MQEEAKATAIITQERSAFEDPSADFSAASVKAKTSYLSTVTKCEALWQLALP